MMMLNHNLQIFLVVADHMSITQAAKELYISQPAISNAIKNLEDELQIKLFHRDKRKGLQLTNAGEKILYQARQMAEAENKLYQIAYQENNLLGGKLTIASIPLLTSFILSPVLKEYREKYPGVTIELLEGTPKEIIENVSGFKADFGLLPEPFTGLDYEILLNDEIVAIQPNPFDEEADIQLGQKPERFILCRSGQETAFEMLREQNISLHKAFLVDDPATVIHFVQDGHGIGLLSHLFLQTIPNKLYQKQTNPSVHFNIGLAAPKLTELSIVAEVCRKMIEEYIHTHLIKQ